MFNNNESLRIDKVENGYMISRAKSYHEIMVFRSMSEMIMFLTEHFSYRCKDVMSDTKNDS